MAIYIRDPGTDQAAAFFKGQEVSIQVADELFRGRVSEASGNLLDAEDDGVGELYPIGVVRPALPPDCTHADILVVALNGSPAATPTELPMDCLLEIDEAHQPESTIAEYIDRARYPGRRATMRLVAVLRRASIGARASVDLFLVSTAGSGQGAGPQ